LAKLLVLDGGACEVGIESTIVDCTRGVPVLLRPGAITRDDIERACGSAALERRAACGHPARLRHALAHYAPNAKVRLMDAKQLQSALDALGRRQAICVYHRSRCVRRPGVTLHAMPRQALAAARSCLARCVTLTHWGPSSSGSKPRPTAPTGKACATGCSARPQPADPPHPGS
jgi:L-threonylcarbamoyladenylate synthase